MGIPVLGGGIGPVEWLRMVARMDRKVHANARADEADRIADWIESQIVDVTPIASARAAGSPQILPVAHQEIYDGE